jgi:hypothetical protein
MTPLTVARLSAIAQREASEHTPACAVGVIDDQPCVCGGLVPITRDERSDILALVQGLVRLGPDLAKAITDMERSRDLWAGVVSMPHLMASQQLLIDLLRQVQALIPKGE